MRAALPLRLPAGPLALGSLTLGSLTLGALALAACGSEPAETPAADTTAAMETPADTARTATATLAAKSGSEVTGEIRFVQEGAGIRVSGTVRGLPPGAHGFHVHGTGDCSAPDATSAGEHFNPAGHPHGRPDADAAARHAGDFGNITADAGGVANVDLLDPVIAFDGANSIVGKAVIVHGNPDDFSQPSGNAGPRLACGVIEMGGIGAAGTYPAGAVPDGVPTDSLAAR